MGEGDRTFATVSVLIEIDPRLDDDQIKNNPALRGVFQGQARATADEMFRLRQPDAVIEHRNDC